MVDLLFRMAYEPSEATECVNAITRTIAKGQLIVAIELGILMVDSLWTRWLQLEAPARLYQW